MNKYLVVIPYLPQGSQGNELSLAIKGWNKHFKEDFTIVIVGEGLDGICGDNVVCIESPRVQPRNGQYQQHLDYVSCFRRVREAYPDHDGFIFAADDNYAVNDFDITDIKTLKIKALDIDYPYLSVNRWRRDAAKTKSLLKEGGYPTRDFTTHVPCWFDFDRLFALYKEYEMDEESYVIEDLYFNIYYKNRVPLLLNPKYDNVRIMLRDTDITAEELKEEMERKIWVCNSPLGWSKELENILEQHYNKR